MVIFISVSTLLLGRGFAVRVWAMAGRPRAAASHRIPDYQP
jgi:hypothetical protein